MSNSRFGTSIDSSVRMSQLNSGMNLGVIEMCSLDICYNSNWKGVIFGE